MKFWWIVGGAVALVACSKQEVPAPQARPVIVQIIDAGGAQQAALYSGEVRARQEGDLAFRIGGKIVERRISAGQSVRKGQVLARLDAQDVGLSAQAAASAVKAAEADAALARAELERAEGLFAQRFISQSALDTRRSQYQATQARLQQAKDQAAVSGNQVRYAELVADRDGVVTAMNVEVGQVVAAGQAVLRLADPASREALIWVPESRVAALRIGDDALVRPWNAQDVTLPGKVREIAGAADSSTRTFAVRVAVSGADERMPLGSTVAVGFLKDGKSAGANAPVRLPLAAVVQREGQASVWIVGKDNTPQPRAVEVAAFRDHEALIRKGLAPGDRVVVVGAHVLKEGMAVKPVEQSAPVALDVLR
ncbi:efflux RND transporter periplasmic adaptor subunit [Viridibacterium curvum]|uniref:efflux RND transporter periplasmic adaptor subunit n=1 Tax=Viridibacterium curvum TaxID=1101404 RepID=UPI0031EDA277